MSRSYKRSGGARGIAGMTLPYIAGGIAGYAAPRVHPYQDIVITALAVAPINLPYGIKKVAQGYVLGSLIGAMLPSVGGIQAQSGVTL